MKAYFKLWRRRFGIVMLALACAFAACWIRSRGYVDFIRFPTGQRSWQEWAIGAGCIRGWMFKTEQPEEQVPTLNWRNVEISRIPSIHGDEQVYRWRDNHFANDGHLVWVGSSPCDAFVPIWSIVIPLTLLSTWLLLLSRPRGSNQHSSPD